MDLIEPPELSLAPGDWPGKVVLNVECHGVLGEQAYWIEAGASSAAGIVGLAVTLDGQWAWQVLDGRPARWFGGHAYLRSLGRESDTLVTALDAFFETNLHPGPMRLETKVEVMLLQGEIEHLETETVMMKVFFNPRSRDRSLYAEAYLNLYLPDGKIELREKDPEYRPALIRSLAKTWDGKPARRSGRHPN